MNTLTIAIPEGMEIADIKIQYKNSPAKKPAPAPPALCSGCDASTERLDLCAACYVLHAMRPKA